MPEVSTKKKLASEGKELRPEDFPNLRRAKIDLFIGDRSSSSGYLRLCMALEVKGPKSNWDAFPVDLDRLRQIARGLEKHYRTRKVKCLFAYVSPPMTENDYKKEKKKFAEMTGLGEDEYRIIPARQGKDIARRSYVYLSCPLQ